MLVQQAIEFDNYNCDKKILLKTQHTITMTFKQTNTKPKDMVKVIYIYTICYILLIMHSTVEEIITLNTIEKNVHSLFILFIFLLNILFQKKKKTFCFKTALEDLTASKYIDVENIIRNGMKIIV